MQCLNDERRISRYTANNHNISKLLHDQIAKIYQEFYFPAQYSFDYAHFGSSESYQTYRLMLCGLRGFNLESLNTDNEKISFWLNIYNMLAIHLIIELKIKSSVSEQKGFFSQYGYQIGGETFSLDDIEHGILRSNSKAYSKLQRPFKPSDSRLNFICSSIKPLVHFGLYCACKSSPTLTLFAPETVEKQLATNMKKLITQLQQPDIHKGIINIPKIFKWYEKDFGTKVDIINIIAEIHPNELISATLTNKKDRIKFNYVNFNWQINSLN